MVKDMGIILDSSRGTHKGIVEGDNIGHHAGDQKLPSHKAGADETDHKSGMHVQTRRDTTEPIPGEPDYVHPDGSSSAIVRI